MNVTSPELLVVTGFDAVFVLGPWLGGVTPPANTPAIGADQLPATARSATEAVKAEGRARGLPP
jgi:hypothetical protein